MSRPESAGPLSTRVLTKAGIAMGLAPSVPATTAVLPLTDRHVIDALGKRPMLPATTLEWPVGLSPLGPLTTLISIPVKKLVAPSATTESPVRACAAAATGGANATATASPAMAKPNRPFIGHPLQIE